VATAIEAIYPDNNWSLSTLQLQMICRLVSETGSAMTRYAGA